MDQSEPIKILNIYVEINQKLESSMSSNQIEKEVDDYFNSQGEIFFEVVLSKCVLPEHINYIRVCPVLDDEFHQESVKIPSEHVRICYCVYQMCKDSPQIDSVDEDSEEVPASLNWTLPNVEFEGLWESLIYEQGLKEELISYVKTTLLYSQNQVCPQVVRWNGVVLLHGPPGTGDY